MDENKLTRSTWMSNIPNSMRIDMDLLDEVTGGTEGGSGYGMENDPLFRKDLLESIEGIGSLFGDKS